MSIWDWLTGRKEKPKALSPAELAEYLTAMGRVSAAGIRVDPQSAMKCHAVATATKVLTESVAQLPFNIIEIGADGSRKAATIPLQRLISTHGRPNEWQTSFEWREWLVRHTALRGNGFYLKNTVNGQLRELLPIHPNRVEVYQDENWNIRYKIRKSDGTYGEYTPRQIFHLRGPGDAGFLGNDVILDHADTIGLCMAQEKFASVAFSNGVNNKGLLIHPNKMGEEAQKRFMEQIQNGWAGLDNAHKLLILEEGMKWENVSQTLEESQLLDSRKFQRSIVVSLWRIPAHMAGDLEKATFSNIENLARQFVDYALVPWGSRIEQAVQAQLMTEAERGWPIRHQAKFNFNALLRGDSKSRAEFYSKMHTISAMNPNEIRDLEDMDRYEDGDTFYRQQNMAPTDEPATDSNDNNQGNEDAPPEDDQQQDN